MAPILHRRSPINEPCDICFRRMCDHPWRTAEEEEAALELSKKRRSWVYEEGVRWFGHQGWNPNLCSPENHIEVPVGFPCVICGNAIEDTPDIKGVTTPYLRELFEDEEGHTWGIVDCADHHLECFLFSITGRASF